MRRLVLDAFDDVRGPVDLLQFVTPRRPSGDDDDLGLLLADEQPLSGSWAEVADGSTC